MKGCRNTGGLLIYVRYCRQIALEPDKSSIIFIKP